MHVKAVKVDLPLLILVSLHVACSFLLAEGKYTHKTRDSACWSLWSVAQ